MTIYNKISLLSHLTNPRHPKSQKGSRNIYTNQDTIPWVTKYDFTVVKSHKLHIPSYRQGQSASPIGGSNYATMCERKVQQRPLVFVVLCGLLLDLLLSHLFLPVRGSERLENWYWFVPYQHWGGFFETVISQVSDLAAVPVAQSAWSRIKQTTRRRLAWGALYTPLVRETVLSMDKTNCG